MGDEGVIDGRYRLGRLIGAGTFGRIHEATAIHAASPHAAPALARSAVAVKILRTHLLESESERARFEREAALIGRLEHPNIVRVLDVGFADGSLPFIVFELLRGRPLSVEQKRVRFMSASRVAGIVGQTLQALAHAHSEGVLHRDIKPSNVFLCHSSLDVDFVKLLDFGVAKPLRPGELERLTATGAMIGTPGYMAPEQLRGDPVGPPADLFAVGMTMARLLSGERFVGETLLEVVRTHLSPLPIPLPRSVVVSELGAVVQRALEKDPRHRFQSAAEMLAAIQEAMSGVPSGPRSASGTLLMPEHLETETSPSSTVPLDDLPWLRRGDPPDRR